VRVPISQPFLSEACKARAVAAVEAGQISSQGPCVAELEARFAAWAGAEDAVAVTNGTVALHLALAGLGVGPGDRVLVPDLTFAATAAAVLHVGATPVLVDVDPATWLLDVEAALAEHRARPAKAVLPVHLYGHPVSEAGLAALREAGLLVVEDAAEAHGAAFASGRGVGTVGHAGAFSFYANKIMTTGEGGMVLCPATLGARLRRLRDHGMDRSRFYWHDIVGFNFRMTNPQAALGLGQLDEIEALLSGRAAIEAAYRRLLEGAVDLGPARSHGRPVCWLATVATPRRDRVLEALRADGVDARPGFTPLSAMPPFAACAPRPLPHAAAVSARLLSLPTFLGIDADTLDGIARTVRAVVETPCPSPPAHAAP
jgi:perosamine synthetase